MNKLIKDLYVDALLSVHDSFPERMLAPSAVDLKFAEMLVFDFLGELTNDDTLGPARIDTICQLARRYGVAR